MNFKSSFSVSGKGAVLATAIFSLPFLFSRASRSAAVPLKHKCRRSSAILGNCSGDRLTEGQTSFPACAIWLRQILRHFSPFYSCWRMPIRAKGRRLARRSLRQRRSSFGLIPAWLLRSRRLFWKPRMKKSFLPLLPDRAIVRSAPRRWRRRGWRCERRVQPVRSVQPAGGGGPAEGIGGNGVNTPNFSYTSNVGGLTSTPNTTTTTITSAVSP